MPNANAARRTLPALGALLWCGACLPYTLGSTAQTVPAHEHRTTGTIWFVPDATIAPSNGALIDNSNPDSHLPVGYDAEVRFGIDSASDWGLRLPMASGVILTYRQRLAGAPQPDSAAVSWQVGGGVINVGEHALFETSLHASSAAHQGVVWYGGIRAVQTAPISGTALDDQPSMGVTLGARIAAGDGGVLPEVSIYHDPAVGDIRKGDFMVVPAVSLYGSWLSELGDVLRVLGAVTRGR